MAVLTREDDLTLEIKVRDVLYWQEDRYVEIVYEFVMKWRGKSIINDAVLKHNSYWGKKGTGNFVATDMDEFHLLQTLQKALETGEKQTWDAFPDPDVGVAVLPNTSFDLTSKEREEGMYTIIIAPDLYQLKKTECYCGLLGAALVMTAEEAKFRQFVKDFATECEKKRALAMERTRRE